MKMLILASALTFVVAGGAIAQSNIRPLQNGYPVAPSKGPYITPCDNAANRCGAIVVVPRVGGAPTWDPQGMRMQAPAGPSTAH